jgi:hypothetical protein
MHTLSKILGTIALLLFLAGCGPSGPAMVKVTGTVTLDGMPVEGANVMFVPASTGKPAQGKTDAAGKFTLNTDPAKPDDGAQEGEYNVAVSGVRTTGVQVNPDGTSGDASQISQVWFVPKQYANPASSGLRQTVTKGMQPVELKLSTK